MNDDSFFFFDNMNDDSHGTLIHYSNHHSQPCTSLNFIDFVK